MKRSTSLPFFLALALSLDASAGPRETALAWLAEQHDYLNDVSEALWAMPEPAHEEHRTSTYIQTELERAGFQIESGVASLATAFVASYGSGRPVIGIVALLDALPGLSQEKLATERRPSSPGEAGHGCGHNLIGAADLGAVLAVKRAIDEHGLRGTVRFFGAPAEEIYHGGVYMARDGVFDDVDALLFWHPSAVTTVITRSGLAMDSIRFVFHGLASDATDAADKGINALTAAYELSAAAERERALWPEDAVLNHLLVEGGTIPSIVPERAVLWFFLHARDRDAVHTLRARLHELAEETSQKTGARVEMQILSSTRHWLINKSVAELLHEYLEEETTPESTQSERELADAMRVAFDAKGEPRFFEGTLSPVYSDERVLISDDTAEASWIAPRGGFLVACFPLGVPSHTWQWTASASSSFAHKGMMRAARTLTKTALELMTNKNTLEVARREFDAARSDAVYESPLPAELGPFDYLKPRPR